MKAKLGKGYYTQIIAPGILLAATGIGASDFFGATWAGTTVGTSILWAVALGALLKYFLTEGMAKWQLCSGNTIVETWLSSFPKPLRIFFIAYFMLWAVLVCAALMGACGLAVTQLGAPALHSNSKINSGIYAALHGVFGLILVNFTKLEWFEKIISVLVGIMFITILICCLRVNPVGNVIDVPSFPTSNTVVILAIISGIGGTVTILSYGYWLREKSFTETSQIKSMRISCVVGYLVSGIFGMCVLYLAAQVLKPQGIMVDSEESAKQAFLKMGALLGTHPTHRYLFISGFYAAVLGSMLGVWQSVPYLFADGFKVLKKQTLEVHLSTTRAYKYFQLGMVGVAMIFVFRKVQELLVLYSLFGSLFMPMLAASLLYLNNKKEVMGKYKNALSLNLFFILVLVLYGIIIIMEALRLFE